MDELYRTVDALMAEGKGILAADESDHTAGEKRLAIARLENTPENRRRMRELFFTTPDLEEVISGIILYDSTIRNATEQGIPFADLIAARGIVPGIKVDAGTHPLDNFEGELVTEGTDGLEERMQEYYRLGARFTKWRAVFRVAPEASEESIMMNATLMARYAAVAQRCGMVPIIEPEVLYEGDHTIEDAAAVTEHVLTWVTEILQRYKVDLKGAILKTSMVLAGEGAAVPSTPEEVADATVRTLHITVPHEMGGIVFLSGGQNAKQATENMNAIAKLGKQPWRLSTSFSRALEVPALKIWRGDDTNIDDAQKVLLKRARMNGDAQKGVYDASNDV